MMEHILSIAVALIAGLLMTRAFKYLKINLPDVTAFLLAGLLVGPCFLGRLGIAGVGFPSYEALDALGMISNAVLGFIAFAIGNEFRLSQLRTTGKQAAVIGVLQAVVTTLLVDAALIGLHLLGGDRVISLPAAITLGAIAAATAPAATLMVVRQYKADGPLTKLLLPIVALDDAVGLVLFAVSLGVAQALQGGTLNAVSVIIDPLLEIVCSLLLGALMGCLLTVFERMFFSNSNRLSLTITFVLMTIALTSVKIPVGEATISFSALLVCMMLGTVFCNLCPRSADIMRRADQWTAPLFALFFVLSGADLELGVFSDPVIVGVGVAYILVRAVGKYVGAWSSSTLMRCEPNVRKYLGVTLFPQAGVALGMCVMASVLGETDGALIRNIVLFGVLIYELAGPLLTRIALARAGEITPGALDLPRRDAREKTAGDAQSAKKNQRRRKTA